uniref:PDZ domain-containing protein n=1 Tax=Mariniflexile sp. TaxID=1979402 RepID=UPI003563AB48
SNIFMSAHKPARMKEPYVNETSVDRNFYAADKAQVMKVSNTLGWDQNSTFGDPMFVNPEKGDFRVKENSPALKMGFKNFPMNQFGVKKPSLKAIARTPEMPILKANKVESEVTQKVKWQGATFSNLSGEEFSAFGVSKEEGGVVLSEILKNSPLAKAGLLEGDLIQAVNGIKTSNVQEFGKVTNALKGTVNLKVVRNQQVMQIKLIN